MDVFILHLEWRKIVSIIKRSYKHRRNVRAITGCSLKKVLAGLCLDSRRERILIWKQIKKINTQTSILCGIPTSLFGRGMIGLIRSANFPHTPEVTSTLRHRGGKTDAVC